MMRSVSHGWKESLWEVIKAFDTKRTRIVDSFMDEFVCLLVSNPFWLKSDMSDDEQGRCFNKFTYM